MQRWGQAGPIQMSAGALKLISSSHSGHVSKIKPARGDCVGSEMQDVEAEGTGSLSIIHRAKWNRAVGAVTTCLQRNSQCWRCKAEKGGVKIKDSATTQHHTQITYVHKGLLKIQSGLMKPCLIHTPVIYVVWNIYNNYIMPPKIYWGECFGALCVLLLFFFYIIWALYC